MIKRYGIQSIAVITVPPLAVPTHLAPLLDELFFDGLYPRLVVSVQRNGAHETGALGCCRANGVCYAPIKRLKVKHEVTGKRQKLKVKG